MAGGITWRAARFTIKIMYKSVLTCNQEKIHNQKIKTLNNYKLCPKISTKITS